MTGVRPGSRKYTCNGHGLRFQSKADEHGSSALDDAWSVVRGAGQRAPGSLIPAAGRLSLGRSEKNRKLRPMQVYISAAENPVSGIGARRRFPRDRGRKDGRNDFMGRKTDKKRGPLSSFPWKGKFKTNAEVEAYFSGDKIQCLLCGKWFHALGGGHLQILHGVTADDYREMYGIPWEKGLIGSLNHEKRSINTKRLIGSLNHEKRSINTKRLIAEGKLKPLAKGEPYPYYRNPDQRPSPECVVAARKSRWRRADFEAILDKIRTLKCPMRELCKNDPHLPSLLLFRKYMNAHPEFAAKLEEIYHSQPYSFQAKVRNFSPRFRIDCERLRADGLTMENIAIKLGVSTSPVFRALKDFNTKMGITRSSFLKWGRRDYEAILERIREQSRVLTDVTKDPDLPCMAAWLDYVKKHPEFLKKLQEVYDGMPYSIQAKAYKLSPRFRKDCERLRAGGKKIREIADIVMVSQRTVGKTLRDFDEKLGFAKAKPRDWSRKDFEAILNRMRLQTRTLNDVCGDPDLPGKSPWSRYADKHPEFAEKQREITLSLPYPLQVVTRDASPRFSVDCQRLRAAGMSLKNIAKSLGVSLVAVRGVLRSLGGKWLQPLPGPYNWNREDFEALLVRIRERCRPLGEVCKDSDLPGIKAWDTFVKRHPEFNEKLREAYYSLPYSFQSRVHHLSPRFRMDCERLRVDGMSIADIGKALKVSRHAVDRTLRDFDEKMGIVRTKPRCFVRKNFEAILNRMRVQQRTVFDVCGDPDLPSFSSWKKFVKKRPEFAGKLRETIYGLPYPIQGKCRVVSPRFRIDCERLRAAGMTIANIHKALGISESTVSRVLRDYNK